MKKIAILAQYPVHLLPDVSDVTVPQTHYATWLPQLATSFGRQTEFEIHWIALSDQVSSVREVKSMGQYFHILPTARSKRALTFFREDRRAINGVLADIMPDLVHGWGTEDVYALAAVTSPYPNLVSMQGILSYYALRSRMHPREYLQAAMELMILRRADAITTESHWGESIVRRISASPVSLVEYGVQYHFLDYKWEPDPAKPAAIFIGSIDARKGIQDAVEAFRHPSLAGKELWVLGGGGSKWAQALQASAPHNVKWIGRAAPEVVAEYLTRAWCLLLPTRADTSPNVVKEARVIGMPVITTPRGGQTTYIREGGAGFLVQPGDVETLIARTSLVLGDYDRAVGLGHIDHELHREQLHPERTAEGFLKIYRQRS